jgi:hypothetical protein
MMNPDESAIVHERVRPIREDLLGMSLDKNSASSELVLTRPGRLVECYWMVGDSENYDPGPSRVITI